MASASTLGKPSSQDAKTKARPRDEAPKARTIGLQNVRWRIVERRRIDETDTDEPGDPVRNEEAVDVRVRVDDVVAADVAQQPKIIAQQHGAHGFAFRAAQIDQVHARRRDRREFRWRGRGEDQDVVAAAGGQMRPQFLEIEPVAGEVRPEARKEVKHAHGATDNPRNDATQRPNFPRFLTGREYALSSGKSA
jgi:hypothetical protein